MFKKRKTKIFSKKVMLPVITIILFVVVSYFSKKYAGVIGEWPVFNSAVGLVVYVLIMITAVIIAPFETLPLLPIATVLWGPEIAAWLTVVGWSIGSLIAFGLARRFGKKFVYKFTDKYNIKEWAGLIPKHNIFWLVAFARFILPVDVISYAVGLFTKMDWLSYLFATLVGVIPFAFLFAYASELNSSVQAIFALILLIVIVSRYDRIKEYIRMCTEYIHEKTNQ